MDETYVKVPGKWVYLYRAVDKAGKTVDFMLSEKRDRSSLLKFFKKAIGSSVKPEKVAKVMTGFKSFEAAEATITGIELHHMLNKNQLDSDGDQAV